LEARRALVTTLSLITMALLIVALSVGFAAPAEVPSFSPPTPLLLSSSKVYEEWLIYHYTQAYLISQSYTLDSQSYTSLLQNLAFSLRGVRYVVFHVNTTAVNLTLYNSQVDYSEPPSSFPLFTVDATIYLPSERALINYTYTVTSPIRYYIAQEFLGVIAGLQNNSSPTSVEDAVYAFIGRLQGMSGTLTLENTGQTSTANLELTDCYLKIYYQTCPIYLGSETLYKVLPNLTLSFSSPA